MIPSNTIKIAIKAASDAGVEPARVLALIEVETRGVACESDGTPVFLCEPHTFYTRLPASERAGALAAGVASKSWSKADYADQGKLAGREARLARMIAIDEDVAYESISMGLGQIMGWHAGDVGYDSASAMFGDFHDNATAQVVALVKLLPVIGALKPLVAGDWKGVAKAYNGAGYRQNSYDTKLATAYAKWHVALASGQTEPATGGELALGSHGPSVTALQSTLTAAGYPARVDGHFGPETMGSIAAFQIHNGLPGNGRLDEATAARLSTATPLPQGARVLATKSTLARTSRIVAMARRARQVHWLGASGTAGVVGLANLDSISGAVDKADQARDLYGKIHDLVTDTGATVWAWGVSHPAIAIAVGAFGIVTVVVTHLLGSIEDARLDDEHSGATV